MRRILFFKRVDVLIAFMVFAVSASALGVSLEKINDSNRRSNLLEHPVRLGKTSIAILSQDRCVGAFEINFSKEQGQSGILIDGTLRTSFRDQVTPLVVKGDFAFNLLGQLGGGFLQMTVGEKRITVGLEEINPIKLTVISPAFGANSRREVVIPGPIELSPAGEGEFQVRYAPLGSRETPISLIARRYGSELGLRVDFSEEVFARCAESTEAFALDEFGERLQEQLTGLRAMLPMAALGPSGSAIGVSEFGGK